MRFERVLVPMDFSADAMNAYEVAQQQFASPETSLVLLHVVEDALPTAGVHQDLLLEGGVRAAGEAAIRRQVDDARRLTPAQDAERKLTALTATHQDRWKSIATRVVVGKPEELILKVAREERADMVVMGAHGTKSIAKTLFGSTAYHVTRKLECSVMVVKRA